MSFCLSAHTTLVTSVEPSAILFTRWVYTLISDSASVISTLLNQGRLFWSLLPHVIIQDHLLLFSVVIYSWRVPMSAICIEYVVCETITLLSFALYLYVRSHVRIFIHMSTRVPREQWQLLVLRSHSSSLPVSFCHRTAVSVHVVTYSSRRS